MYPIEATAAKSIWGLPTLIWGILIGTIVILSVILATLFFCCWLQPRTRKLLNSGYYVGSSVSHSSIVPKSQTGESNQLVMPLSIGICPPQYSAPPPPTGGNSSSGGGAGTSGNNHHSNQQSCPSSSAGIPCHPSAGNSNAAAYHGKYGSSPQFAHQQYHQQQQQQQFQHHHQCIHHQQQQQQQQQYHAHYAHIQQHQQHPQQQQGSPYATTQHQQTLQQYYNQQHQQHQQQQQQQHMQQHQHQHQKLTHYVHPAQQQALQHQQQREHQIQQHHYHHQQQQQQQHHHHQQQQQQQQGQLVHHKSMWAINPLYASSGVINDSTSGDGSGENDEEGGNTSYRTRSLPSWGKNKQRPLSNADDLEELYAKVNFSKKRRNRMRNDEAAIIALCRSRSQNLSSLPLTDQDAVVVYDERTAL